MMNLRSLVLLAGLASVAALTGCSAGSDEAGSASADVTESALAEQTLIKGKIAIGETSTVAYEPDTNYTQTKYAGVPYLAWELVTPPAKTGLGTRSNGNVDVAPDTLTLTISGHFPGSPDVLVVDESFAVLGQTRGESTVDGDLATLTIDANVGSGKKLVLVRDMIWVAPMSFDISVTQLTQ